MLEVCYIHPQIIILSLVAFYGVYIFIFFCDHVIVDRKTEYVSK